MSDPLIDRFIDIMDRADVVVLESRGGLRFVNEAFFRLGVSSELWREKLQGDSAFEADAFGFVDDTHTPCPGGAGHVPCVDDLG